MMRQILTDTEGTTDWTKGVVRPVFTHSWPLFLVIHVLIGGLGGVFSIYMAIDIIRNRWHNTNTGKYLLNLAVCNTIIAIVGLPMMFVIMLYENWIFGQAFCFFAAILPYAVVHCCMITFIALIIDRYRYIAHPEKKQINVIVLMVSIWVLSICAASPALAYTHYRDIGHLDSRLRNNGLCWSTGDDYSRVVFATIFTLPLLVVIILLVKISSEIKTKKALNQLYHLQAGKESPSGELVDVNSIAGEDCKEQFKDTRWLKRQQCSQKYLTFLIVLWAVCWVPIKLFSMINMKTVENSENMNQIDLAHMIFLPISAICTITTPCCYRFMMQQFKKDKYQSRSESETSYQLVSSSTSESNNSRKNSTMCSSFVGIDEFS